MCEAVEAGKEVKLPRCIAEAATDPSSSSVYMSLHWWWWGHGEFSIVILCVNPCFFCVSVKLDKEISRPLIESE